MNNWIAWITVDFNNGTYTARARGWNRTASSTESERAAARGLAEHIIRAVGRKVPYSLKQYGSAGTWILSPSIPVREQGEEVLQ